MPTKSTTPRSRSRKKAAVRPSTLHVGFVWDMSGSMASIAHASVEGTRGYLADLQKEEQKIVDEHGEGVSTYITVTAFDTVLERWLDGVPALELDLGQLNRYQPRGGTALYDAIADTVVAMDTRVHEGEKVLVVVMTDGGENSSQEYALRNNGRQRLHDLITAYEARGNWTFVYLGANVDSYAEASAIGIPTGNTAYYAATMDSVAVASAGVSKLSSNLRSAGGMSTSSAFVDAGLSNDYRDPNATSAPVDPDLWTPGSKKKAK